MNYRTLTEVLLDRVDSDSYVTLIAGQGKRERLPYRELFTRAQSRLAQLQSAGLQPGDNLIIQVADIAQFLEGFWACLLGGITAVPLAGGSSAEHRFKLFRVAEKLGSAALFTDAQTLTRLQEFATKNQLEEASASLLASCLKSDSMAPAEATAIVAQPDENDVAFIQFSSGSTSTPKGVVLTHKNLLTNLHSIVSSAQMDGQTHQFSWMPLTHDMGLIGFHLTPVFMDNHHSLMPTDVFVRRPGAWLHEAQAVGATVLCSPNFGYQHLLKTFKAEKFNGLDLSRIQLIFNGAEPISVSLCHRFMQALAPFSLAPSAMYPVYGLAEASLAVSFPPLGDTFSTLVVDRSQLGIGQGVSVLEQRTASPSSAVFAHHSSDERTVEFVSVGHPVLDVGVSIRSEQGSELPSGTIGCLCIRGDNVTQGYLNDPALNEQIISADGWLNTGDLGFVYDGELYITGRAKDIIFVNGQNVYPHDLEEIIFQAGCIERGKLAVAGQSVLNTGAEHLVLFVLHRGSASDLEDTARAMTHLLAESAGVAVHAVVPVPRIPKTTSGKVQRYLLLEALAQGEYEVLAQSRVEPIDESTPVDEAESAVQDTQAQLLSICNDLVEELTVGPTDNLFDLGISSLTLAQIHGAIEEAWPEQVDITDLFDYPTVAELAQFLDAKSAD